MPRAYDLAWDEQKIAQLRELWAKGDSARVIGERLGTSRNSILGKAHRLGLPGRPSPLHAAIPGAVPKRSRRTHAVRQQVAREVIQLPTHAPSSATVHAATPPPSAPLPELPSAASVERLTSQCCWPIGTPRTPKFRYCDAPCPSTRPYCAAHHAAAYVAQKPKPIGHHAP